MLTWTVKVATKHRTPSGVEIVLAAVVLLLAWLAGAAGRWLANRLFPVAVVAALPLVGLAGFACLLATGAWQALCPRGWTRRDAESLEAAGEWLEETSYVALLAMALPIALAAFLCDLVVAGVQWWDEGRSAPTVEAAREAGAAGSLPVDEDGIPFAAVVCGEECLLEATPAEPYTVALIEEIRRMRLYAAA